MPNFTGTNADEIFTGGVDPDTATGGGGNDTLSGGGGDDTLAGDSGSDILNGGTGDDWLYSASISTGGIPPQLDVGNQHDTLIGGDGSDRIYAGYGDDVDGGTNTVYGDYLHISFLGAPSGVTVDFRLATQTIGGGTITGIENISWVQGSNFADNINVESNGSGYTDFTYVYGMGGADTLKAGYYTWLLDGGDGNDFVDGRGSQYLQYVYGGAGDDTLYTHTNGSAIAYGGDGNDTIYANSAVFGGAGNDLIIIQDSYYPGYVFGESGNDEIRASSTGSQMSGGAGADTLIGFAGTDGLYSAGLTMGEPEDDVGLEHDELSAGAGDDTIWAGYGDDVDGGTGNDILRLSFAGATSGVTFNTSGIGAGTIVGGGTIQGIETLTNLRGSNFNDNLTIATQEQQLTVDAGAGNDTITSNASSVNVLGGDGNDRFISGIAADTFDGGTGADTIDYRNATAGVNLTIAVAGATFSGPGGDSLKDVENIDGSAFNDTLRGNDDDNVLRGMAGNDTLVGNGGNDTLNGGDGIDTASYSAASAAVTVSLAVSGPQDTGGAGIDSVAEIENLTGSAHDDSLTGNGLANVLDGGAGNDTLTSGAGADQLRGGTGDDIYDVESASATITENAGAGTDTVRTALTSFVLGANVENLLGLGAVDQWLAGNGLANQIDGGAGIDTISYAASAGAVDVDLSRTTAQLGGDAEGDLLSNIENATGSANADVLAGNSDSNVLDGGLGADTMSGGAGDDIFVVDNAGDQLTEDSGGGIDRVLSSITWSLSDNLENLDLTGSAALNGFGNALDNQLTGNSGNNVLDGGAGADTMTGFGGNDTYYVDNVADTVVETNAADGVDRVVSGISFTLGANLENLVLVGAGAIDGTGNELNNRLIGSGVANTLRGEDGDDTISGDLGDDTLEGGAGNDTLDGGEGIDNLIGGLGNDTYVISDATDSIVDTGGVDTINASFNYVLAGSLENLTLAGTAAIDGTGNGLNNVITGNAAANALSGEAGNDNLAGGGGSDTLTGGIGIDLLDGGLGADSMTGGAGNDTYVVDNALDSAIEAAGGGTDLVQSSVTHSLGSEIENLTLTGNAAINGTGNGLANVIAGNSGVNLLDGGAGNDTMTGGAGNDTYVFDSVSDKAIEAAGGGTDKVLSSVGITLGAEVENLTLTGAAAINGTGNALANTILGNGAANILNGGAGDDSMTGGAGDDLYVVDSISDKAIEAAGGGVDRVQSSVTFILGAEVENLTLTGAAAINGTGNGLANMLTGNAAANVLDGKAGADVMQGGAGDDTYVVDDLGDLVSDSSATGGIDLVKSAVSFTLGVNLENLTLTGSAVINANGNGLDNIIFGNAGANLIDGKGGADTMTGGAGDDTYFIDNVGDVAIETNAAHGVDTVRSGLSYTLGANIENLVLTGPGAIDGTGSSANNILTGNGAANVLSGLLGNDTLLGGGGADTLKGATGNDIMEGGTGADSFIFDSALNAITNLDHVVDFAHGSDKLVLENARFSGLAAGALSANVFVVGTAASDANDRIIYDAATGALYFDSDGTGAAAQVQFATLDNMPVNLSASDFLVI